MKISDFQDRHKDKLCFILGAGPSLHFVNEESLKEYVTISVNSSIIKAKWCDYFLTDDRAVSGYSYYKRTLKDSDCIKLLYRDKLFDKCSDLNNVYLFSHTWWYSPDRKIYNKDGLILRKDEPIIGALTSAGSALHFAYIMGCNPIVLIGCDCCYKDGNRYFWQYEGEEKIEIPSIKKQKENDNYYEDHYNERFLHYWRELAKTNKVLLDNGLEIIDTSDGLIDCFKKMSVGDILTKYGYKKKG